MPGDGISVQFVYVPDEGVHGILLSENLGYAIVRYDKDGIRYEELFDVEDLIYTKSIFIPFEEESF